LSTEIKALKIEHYCPPWAVKLLIGENEEEGLRIRKGNGLNCTYFKFRILKKLKVERQHLGVKEGKDFIFDFFVWTQGTFSNFFLSVAL
jgi:hypothetical protein